MQRYRVPLLVLAVAVGAALVAYLLLRSPSDPAVDARSGGGASGIMLVLILAAAAMSKRKKKDGE